MLVETIKIDQNSGTPKYRQIINSIIDSIENKKLKRGDKIPSINQICKNYSLSRDTVMVAFNELKARGILTSMPGKGYYIDSTDVHNEKKVFVLFDELNAFKEELYNSLVSHLEEKASVDVFFHHFNRKLFNDLISGSVGNYTSYIIMPATFDDTYPLLSQIPIEKLFILDRMKSDLSDYPVIYQDFENDFYDALNQGSELLKKYNRLIFVNPGGKEPMERTIGFKRFCLENNFEYEIIKSINHVDPTSNQAYFLLTDHDLVELVKTAKEQNLTLGKELGVVSFNDTKLKEVVAGGITTISTDFAVMGKKLARMVLNNENRQIRNDARLIIRNSL